MNQELIDVIIKTVIAVASVLITGYLIPFIRSKVDSNKLDDCMLMIEKCVEAANQLYTPEEWKEKKAYVLELIEEFCAEHGVNITDKEIDALIEGFVQSVKGN